MNYKYEKISSKLGVSIKDIISCSRYLSLSSNYKEDDIISVVYDFVSSSPSNLKYSKYSEKSFVVRGDEISNSQMNDLSKLGGKLNLYLRGGPGFIFSNFMIDDIRFYLDYGIVRVSKYGKILLRDKKSWYKSIEKSFPVWGKGRLKGTYYINIIRKSIPPPNHLIDYDRALLLYKPTKSYWPAEALSIWEEFNGKSKKGDTKVFSYSDGSGNYSYWVTGPNKNVSRWLREMKRKFPVNPYGTFYWKSKDGKQLYLTRGSSD